jgi:hypothetical protein
MRPRRNGSRELVRVRGDVLERAERVPVARPLPPSSAELEAYFADYLPDVQPQRVVNIHNHYGQPAEPSREPWRGWLVLVLIMCLVCMIVAVIYILPLLGYESPVQQPWKSAALVFRAG